MVFTIPEKRHKIGKKTTASISSIQPREFTFGTRSPSASIFDSILPKDNAKLNQLYRNIYMTDSVSGAAVDLMAVLPFSEYSISGVQDKTVLQVFQDTCEHLNVRTIMPQLCVEYLTIGKLIGTLVFNGTLGIFTDLIVQDPDFCETTPIPLQGYDPKVDIRVPPEFRQFLTSRDPRDKEARSELPEDLIRSMLSGKVALDPLTTLYVARKTHPRDTGTSYLSRIVPFYMLEQLLLEGTIQGAQRRQRAIMHIQAGSDDWEPTETQLDELIELFTAADMDPIGAIVATKRDIDINEVRSGADFWKVTDEWDGLTAAKMRSLGINESFLSGDATYNCVTGDTLVPTLERGIVRIDNMADRKNGDLQDLNTTVGSIAGWEKNKKWLYQGKAPCIKTVTGRGYSLKSTPKHPVLILKNNELVLQPTGKLKIGDWACISKKKTVRKTPLRLEVPYFKIVAKLSPKLPKYMTPQLAFGMGLISAEGTITKHSVRFGNSDQSLTTAFCNSIQNVFNVPVDSRLREIQGTLVQVGNSIGIRNYDFQDCIIENTSVVNFLEKIGMGNETSHDKEIPWSILQADEQSQLAYMAGYIEGDGHISKREIRIHSYSIENLKQFQVLLQAHGFISKINRSQHAIYVTGEDSTQLLKEIKPYMVSSKRNAKLSGEDQYWGIPTCWTKGFIKERYIGYTPGVGYNYRCDDGHILTIQKRCPIIYGKLFSRRWYRRGTYEPVLRYIKQFSPTEERKLRLLLKSDLYFTPIVKLAYMGEWEMYDISMADGTSHIFVGNGILQRQTMEAALSVFIEQLRSFRLYMTQKLFYHKIFPTLARVHRFVKRKQSELDHNIRITGFAKDPKNIPIKDLIIPDIQWHKQLQPQYDESYLSILTTVQDQGVPIPLRVWAAASGFSIEKVLDSLNEDLETRTKLQEWKKKVKEIGGGEGEEEVGFSSLNRPAKRRLPSKKLVKVLSDAKKADPNKVAKLIDFRDRLVKEPNLEHKKLLSGIS